MALSFPVCCSLILSELETPRLGLTISDGWDAYHGFNTVAIKVRDAAVMTAEEKSSTQYLSLLGLSLER